MPTPIPVITSAAATSPPIIYRWTQSTNIALYIAGMIWAAGLQTEKQPKVHPYHCWLTQTSYPLRPVTPLGLFALNAALEDGNQSPELILHLYTHCHELRCFQCPVKPENSIAEWVMAQSNISMQTHAQVLRSRGSNRYFPFAKLCYQSESCQ